MLCNIDPVTHDRAHRLLTLLCYSMEPLTVEEMIEAMAVDLTEPARFDPASRLQDSDDLREICPGLIDFEEIEESGWIWVEADSEPPRRDSNEVLIRVGNYDDPVVRQLQFSTKTFVRIAHFSVREYLGSDRIKISAAKSFAMDASDAHAEISELCVTYMLQPALREPKLTVSLRHLHLIWYAVNNWREHSWASSADVAKRKQCVYFLNSNAVHADWLRLAWSCAESWAPYAYLTPPSTPLYFAAGLGLTWAVEDILTKSENPSALVIEKGGVLGTPYAIAEHNKHEHIQQLLISHELEG